MMTRTMRHAAISLLGILLLAGAAHAQSEKKYRIKLDRPYRAGDAFTVSAHLLVHVFKEVMNEYSYK